MLPTIRPFFQTLLVTLAVFSRVGALTYSCAPDDTITVSGFTGGENFYAVQGSTQCAVAANAAGTSITITGCTKDSEILVTYGSYGGMVTYSLHGGSTVNAFKITCNEIATNGVSHFLTNAFTASLSIDANPTTEPTYSVTSTLTPSSVTVGDTVTMTITFPSSYTMEVRECDAFPGTSDSDTASKIALVGNNGCTSASELITDFTVTSGSATATIDAFKFYKSEYVFFKCKVRVCPSAGTANCVTACPLRRKRLDRYSNESSTGHESEYIGRELTNVLKVTDPFENNSNAVIPNGWIAMTIIMIVHHLN